ncbi:MAG: radical SAM protein [Planctomycetota bacterium]
MAEERKYLYGPVPSRRLGRSLGVDIMPSKICTLDCVYCQIGRTSHKTIERVDCVAVEQVLDELRQRLAAGVDADFITVSGSGEPTLHLGLGELIGGIRKITEVPIAVVTNGTLLYRADVRADCARADVVLPSLDAGDEETFRRMNRPHTGISIEKLIGGLCALRAEFTGRIWLEVFLVEGLNTSAEQLAGIREAIGRIKPDKVQLNTAVRPTAEPGLVRLSAERLQYIAGQIGHGAEVIADFSAQGKCGHSAGGEDVSVCGFSDSGRAAELLSMLKRRPCSLADICAALGMHHAEALKCIAGLQSRGMIDRREKDGVAFFEVR